MLQPSQIDSVLLRFGAEIADVRAFLRGTGIVVEVPTALRDVVQRLTADKTFHRDLGSHAWMLLYSGATVPETLAVLATAAAGARFAANADEHDAHNLLRFIMESRNALNGRETAAPIPAETQKPVPFTPRSVAEPEAPVRASSPVVPIRPASSSAAQPAAVYQPGTLRSITPAIGVPDSQVDDAPDELPTRHVVESQPARGRGWIIAAVCLLALLAACWWMLRRPSPQTETATQPAPVVDATGTATAAPPVPQPAPAAVASPSAAHIARSVREPVTKPSAVRDTRPPAFSPVPPSRASQAPQAAPPHPVQQQQPMQRVPQVAAASPSAATTAQPVLRASNTAPAPVTRTGSPVIASAMAAPKGSAVPVPSSVLAGRLGSPAANQADAVDDRVEGSHGYPRLLRRKPYEANGTLVAKNNAPSSVNIPAARAATFTGGTVRSTSLGISAGNLVYAPDPAYPAAAASQHISGQVTVQAMVDRQGNVASARVVSGPPLLRDAAVSAVQQWRYKPFTAGGKPQTFAATAVLDFQLP